MAEPKLGQIALKLVLLDSLLLVFTVGSHADSQRASILALLAMVSFNSFKSSLDFEPTLGTPVLLQVSESSGCSECCFIGGDYWRGSSCSCGTSNASSFSI